MNGVRSRRARLYDDARVQIHLLTGSNANAALQILVVGEPGLKACGYFYDNLDLRLDQVFACARRQRDAPLARERLARDADDKRYETPP
jgi:hypothetical protein